MKRTVVPLLAVTLTLVLAIVAVAQPASKTPPKPAPAAPKKATRPAVVELPITLTPGLAVVQGKNVNVRGRATISSEALTQLNPGDSVTVIGQVNLEKYRVDEPRQWAKIALPEKLNVWVHSNFIDRTNMTVIPAKLNIRSGPGENYSVVGTLERGAQVKEVLTDGNWTKISAPSGVYAYIAAMYLHQEATATPPATTVASTPVVQPEAAPATEPAPATPETAAKPEGEPEVAATPESAAGMMTMPAPALLPVEPAPEPPPLPRVVDHEGIVTSTMSIQAPTEYQLTDPDTGRIVNYLYSSTTNLDLSLYKGLRIVVTGEEGLDPRWKTTPVITIRRIHVVE
jgi:uncharacterized protein YgiM (DUF1202 family)